MQSHFIYPLQLDSLFLPGGDFPLSVAILHMYPCIENRYVPLLGTSFFAHYDSHILLVCNYKAVLLFFKLFKYLKKSKKIKKNQKVEQGKMLSFGSCQVMSPLNRAMYITSIGWVYSLTLGAILVYLSLSPPTG